MFNSYIFLRAVPRKQAGIIHILQKSMLLPTVTQISLWVCEHTHALSNLLETVLSGWLGLFHLSGYPKGAKSWLLFIEAVTLGDEVMPPLLVSDYKVWLSQSHVLLCHAAHYVPRNSSVRTCCPAGACSSGNWNGPTDSSFSLPWVMQSVFLIRESCQVFVKLWQISLLMRKLGKIKGPLFPKSGNINAIDEEREMLRNWGSYSQLVVGLDVVLHLFFFFLPSQNNWLLYFWLRVLEVQGLGAVCGDGLPAGSLEVVQTINGKRRKSTWMSPLCDPRSPP